MLARIKAALVHMDVEELISLHAQGVGNEVGQCRVGMVQRELELCQSNHR